MMKKNYKPDFFSETYKSFTYNYKVTLTLEDKYISSGKNFTKNGEKYDPIYEFEAKQRELERNKKYDVSVTILGSRYLFENVTKSEINDKYNEIILETFSGKGHPDMGQLGKTPPLDWYKDIDMRKEYN